MSVRFNLLEITFTQKCTYGISLDHGCFANLPAMVFTALADYWIVALSKETRILCFYSLIFSACCRIFRVSIIKYNDVHWNIFLSVKVTGQKTLIAFNLFLWWISVTRRDWRIEGNNTYFQTFFYLLTFS